MRPLPALAAYCVAIFAAAALAIQPVAAQSVLRDAETEQLLKDNMDKLHAMAEALMKYETIDANQIDDIMAGRPPREPEDWHADEEPPASGEAEKVDHSKDSGSKGQIGGPAQQH